MARDYAKKSQGGRRKTATRKQGAKSSGGGSSWRWFGAGLISGVFLSFLLYLGTLAPEHPGGAPNSAEAEPPAEDNTPKPRFDFYTMLPEHSIEVEADPEQVARTRTQEETSGSEYYLLQAGSFRNAEDADRRRGELILLGLEPRIEESTGGNGRWYRVYVGPFDSRTSMAKARSLTTAENIETLLLKRGQSQ